MTSALEARPAGIAAGGTQAEPFVRIEGITKRFGGIVALNGIDMQIERGCRQLPGDGQRRVGAAVIHIDDLAGQLEFLPQPARHRLEPLVQALEAGRFVVQRHDDRQPMAGRRHGRSGQIGDVGT